MGKVNKRKNHHGNGGAHMQHPIQHPIQAPYQDQAKIKKEFELEKDIFEMFGKMMDLTKPQEPTLELLKSVLHQPIDSQKGGTTFEQYFMEKINELKILLPGQPLKIPPHLIHILQEEINQKKALQQQMAQQQQQQQQMLPPPTQQENMQAESNQSKQYHQQMIAQQQQALAKLQGAVQKAKDFNAQFDPSQYQPLNQVGKNIQDLQEQFTKQQQLPQQKMVPHPPQKHQVPKSPQKQQIEQMQMIKKQIMKESGHSLTEQQMEHIILQLIKNGGPHFDKHKKTISVNIDGQIIEAPSDGTYQYQQQFAMQEGQVNFHHSSNDIEDMNTEEYDPQMMMAVGQGCPRNNMGQQCMGENCACALQNEGDDDCGEDGEDDQEEDDEEFEDEEDEYYPESMQYEAANQQIQQQQQYHQNNGQQQQQMQQNNQMVEDEDDEEEYENDEYAEDEEEEEEEELEDENEDMETMENSNGTISFSNANMNQQQQNNSSRYDYGTDNEGEDDDQNIMEDQNTSTLADISQDSVTMRILQTEISQEDFNNFQHKCTLNLPSQLSQKFVRLSKEFNNNIDYIMSYVYKLVGQQQLNQTISLCASQPSLQLNQQQTLENNIVQPGALNADGTPCLIPEKNRFASKYENLIKQSTELCRKYTGPHSVLQIFLEKIIHCIGKISLQIKNMAKNELMLWKEYKTVVRKTSAMQRSSSADSSLLITTTSNNQDKNCNGTQPPRLIRPHQMEESYNISVRFKPLIPNIEAYTRFLHEVQTKYLFIMKTCATQVSRHFTTMTAVIIEGNSYEFPSIDLHKAIINKLIMNDSHHFKQFFVHIKRQYKKDEAYIKENFSEFTKIVESFLTQLEQDSLKTINIDQYMRDLKRHAYAEYKTLYEREQNTNCNSDSKSRRKKKKEKLKKAAAIAAGNQTQNTPGQQQQQQPMQGQNQQQHPIPPQNRQNAGGNQQNFQQQPIPSYNHQQQRKGNNQQHNQNVQAPQYNNWVDPQPGTQGDQGQDNQQQQYVVTGKKKRNRKRKKQDGKLTTEEFHNMPTDDLYNYIENKTNQNPDQNGVNNGGGSQSGTNNQRAASKIKKKNTQNMNGSSMSIEDQESKRHEKHIMEDIKQQQNLGQNEFKNMNVKDNQNAFQSIKDQQRALKQPKNFQATQNPGKGGFEANNIPYAQQYENSLNDFQQEDSQLQYSNQNNGMINDQQCNYCNGSIHSTPQGHAYFSHEENCMFFKRDYGSENDEDSESEGVSQSNNGDFIGSHNAPSASDDIEGDREVDILRRRLERFEVFQLKRKMKPNINKDWITKLKEKIRILNHHASGSPPAPALSAERGPQTSQKPNTSSQSTANNGGGRKTQSQRLGSK